MDTKRIIAYEIVCKGEVETGLLLAEEIYTKKLELCSDSHPSAVALEAAICSFELDLGHIKTRLPLYEKVYNKVLSIYGYLHSETLSTKSSLGFVMFEHI